MAHGVCPHWVGYLLVSPLRRLFHDPEKILRPFVSAGMTVLDIGSAMGFFSLPLAGMVGPSGKVVAVDVQEKMLRFLQKRACKSGVENRIIVRLCKPESLDLGEFEGKIDFAMAFAVIHEVPDPRLLFNDVVQLLKPGGKCLIAEPKVHVPASDFRQTLSVAREVGLHVTGNPGINGCHTALLCKET